MSRVRARYLKYKLTRWRQADYDKSTPYETKHLAPEVIQCSYAIGGEMQFDRDGAEFSPKTTFYIQSDLVKEGDFIILGEYNDAAPPKSAEKVRRIKTKPPLRGLQDYTIYTG